MLRGGCDHSRSHTCLMISYVRISFLLFETAKFLLVTIISPPLAQYNHTFIHLFPPVTSANHLIKNIPLLASPTHLTT